MRTKHELVVIKISQCALHLRVICGVAIPMSNFFCSITGLVDVGSNAIKAVHKGAMLVNEIPIDE